jgi:hypothetical protein
MVFLPSQISKSNKMKKYLGILLVSCFSCTKFHDLQLQNTCRIETMYVDGPYDSDEIQPLNFYYDEFNDPVEITTCCGWNETYLFNYDDHRRLISYSQVGYHHNLTYNENNVAIIDTLLEDFAGGETWHEEKIFYDGQNRIVQTIRKMFKSNTWTESEFTKDTISYVYDSNGNLESPGLIYDTNKTSPFRLNKVFMFVFRNYNKNVSSSPGTTYNEFGLPLTTGDGQKLFEYQCKASQ